MMKRRSWGTILLVLFLVGCYANAQYAMRNQLPERDTFQLDVQCEEGLKSGDTGVIFASLENWGEGDYYLNYSDLFTVYMNGKQITPQNDGTDSWMLDSGDEVSEDYDLWPENPESTEWWCRRSSKCRTRLGTAGRTVMRRKLGWK